MPTIVLSGVTKAYPGRKPVLETIDLAIADGEFLAVIGPSGSGKSTLLRLIAGLVEPSDGSIKLGGRDGSSLAPRDRSARASAVAGLYLRRRARAPRAP